MTDAREYKLKQLLYQHVQQQEHANVEIVARELLSLHPEAAPNITVLQCLVTSLVFLDRFDDALKRLHDYSDSSPFVHAYALYRTRQHARSSSVLEQDNANHRHLLAQIATREENFEIAVKIYEELLDESDTDENRSDVLTNLTFALVSARRFAETIKVFQSIPVSTQTYAILFNAATAFIALREYDAAVDHLQRALQLVDINGLDEAEARVEYAPIQAQLGCAYQAQGDVTQAQSLYLKVLQAFPANRTDQLVAVACTNLISLRRGSQKIHASRKRSDRAQEVESFKLTKAQISAIKRNEVLLLMYEKQSSKCRSALNAMPECIDDDFRELVFAALLFREKKMQKCQDKLKTCNSANARLSLAQVYLLQRNVSEALNVLNTLSTPLRFRPAIVAVIVSLHEQSKRIEDAAKILQAAASYWQEETSDDQTLFTIMCACVDFHLTHGFFTEAHHYLLMIFKSRNSQCNFRGELNERELLARLALASSRAGLDDAEDKAKNLDPLKPLSSDEIDALDKQVGRTATSYKRKPRTSVRHQTTVKTKQNASESTVTSETKKKRKRKRKIMLPKGFDPLHPGAPPDPERWLPKYERSYYRRGRRRNDDSLMKGPQGMVASETRSTLPHRTRARRDNREREPNQPSRPEACSTSTTNAPQKRKKKKKGAGVEY